MAGTPKPDGPMSPKTSLPYQDKINQISVEDLFLYLAAGWRDFKSAGVTSLAYGAIFVIAGLVMTVGMYFGGWEYLIAPSIEGFLLVGPSLTVGFYAISKKMEVGESPTFIGALNAWRVNMGSLLAMGLAQLCFLVIWLRISVLIFAINFPYVTMDLKSMLNVIFFTFEGYVFLATGTVFGAGLALVAFMTGVVSLPLLLDRKVDLVQALVTSVVAVIVNFRVMMVWAVIVVVVTGVGLVAGLVGLAVTLPLIGHANWHAYRGLIKPPAEEAAK